MCVGSRALRRHRLIYEDNIKTDFKKCKGVNWIYLAQNRTQWWDLGNMTMNLRVH
jgi:hypothetical protein